MYTVQSLAQSHVCNSAGVSSSWPQCASARSAPLWAPWAPPPSRPRQARSCPSLPVAGLSQRARGRRACGRTTARWRSAARATSRSISRAAKYYNICNSWRVQVYLKMHMCGSGYTYIYVYNIYYKVCTVFGVLKSTVLSYCSSVLCTVLVHASLASRAASLSPVRRRVLRRLYRTAAAAARRDARLAAGRVEHRDRKGGARARLPALLRPLQNWVVSRVGARVFYSRDSRALRLNSRLHYTTVSTVFAIKYYTDTFVPLHMCFTFCCSFRLSRRYPLLIDRTNWIAQLMSRFHHFFEANVWVPYCLSIKFYRYHYDSLISKWYF